ncbi:MAG: D-aminoacyl-tRNA deacylase [bacterium]
MKALIQRVSGASVTVGGRITGRIQRGLLVFLCVVKGDTRKDLEHLVKKVSGLRIFEDSAGKMNLSVQDIHGGILVISQFTLAARTEKGNRPSFDDAESLDVAGAMYLSFVGTLKETGLAVETGVFGEHMDVSLVNDGPVTILIDSRKGNA